MKSLITRILPSPAGTMLYLQRKLLDTLLEFIAVTLPSMKLKMKAVVYFTANVQLICTFDFVNL